MKFVASKNVVHRDLASRNVLCSSSDNEFDCKISDFGLSRKISSLNKQIGVIDNSNPKLPVIWTAPELLMNRLYSEKSDVWSYGILLYELDIYGEKPYYKAVDGSIVPNQQVVNILVVNGMRHRAIGPLPLDLKQLMMNCWNLHPIFRPTFTKIVNQLNSFLSPKRKKKQSLKKKRNPSLKKKETPSLKKKKKSSLKKKKKKDFKY